jgi:hypothetical protein
MKVFRNASVTEVESEMDLFTKHVLHINSKGKKQKKKNISKRNF